MDCPVYVYINVTCLQSSTKEYSYDFKFHFKMIFFIALYRMYLGVCSDLSVGPYKFLHQCGWHRYDFINVSVKLQTESQTMCSVSEVVLVHSPGLVMVLLLKCV